VTHRREQAHTTGVTHGLAVDGYPVKAIKAVVAGQGHRSIGQPLAHQAVGGLGVYRLDHSADRVRARRHTPSRQDAPPRPTSTNNSCG
jgi:hypothetical protein